MQCRNVADNRHSSPYRGLHATATLWRRKLPQLWRVKGIHTTAAPRVLTTEITQAYKNSPSFHTLSTLSPIGSSRFFVRQ